MWLSTRYFLKNLSLCLSSTAICVLALENDVNGPRHRPAHIFDAARCIEDWRTQRVWVRWKDYAAERCRNRNIRFQWHWWQLWANVLLTWDKRKIFQQPRKIAGLITCYHPGQTCKNSSFSDFLICSSGHVMENCIQSEKSPGLIFSSKDYQDVVSHWNSDNYACYQAATSQICACIVVNVSFVLPSTWRAHLWFENMWQVAQKNVHWPTLCSQFANFQIFCWTVTGVPHWVNIATHQFVGWLTQWSGIVRRVLDHTVHCMRKGLWRCHSLWQLWRTFGLTSAPPLVGRSRSSWSSKEGLFTCLCFNLSLALSRGMQRQTSETLCCCGCSCCWGMRKRLPSHRFVRCLCAMIVLFTGTST